MAGIKITALPAAPSAQLTDVFPVDQLPGPVTYKESNSQLFTLFKANGEALTAVNDTNVTMALGGAPTTSLLNATSMTLGWTGQLSVPRGGTGNTTFTAYSVICAGTTATGAFQNVVGVGNAGEQLTSNGAGLLPTWQPSSTVTPSALTRTDDTNVTITLGGTPTTALLQSTSLTMGWTGTLSPSRGGTGVANTGTFTVGGNTSFIGAFTFAGTVTGNTSVTFPTSGTLATTSQLPTPAALTKGDDTNVTLTLGGTPATSLLQATSITAGWSGQLSSARGGTGVNNGSSTITLGGSLTTSGSFASTFTMTGITGVTFPTSGTLATTSQIPTGAALTKTDDTNVTLALGGSPTTALVNPSSLTLGWTGQLGVSRGGTGISSFGTGVATALGQNVNGSGAISLATNATFVTPTLGAASATSITFSSTSGIIGTTTNNDAAAGSVGEEGEGNIPVGTPVSLTNGTAANVTSFVLQPGDYDVWANIGFNGGATTLVTDFEGWLSTTSATLPAASRYNGPSFPASGQAIFASNSYAFQVPAIRVTVAAATTTTVYLSARAGFTVSTCVAFGGWYWRRRR